MANTYVHEDLHQLIERLKPVHNFLEQNHYVKHTSTKLKRIMDDAQTKTTILMMGKERVGKTTTINSYLNRNILPSSVKNPTKINTFLKYSENEFINAVFYDGVEITFDLNKLPLLTISDLLSAQIIREHIDYIEIYLQHKSLQNVSFVDSTAIESDAKGGAYFSTGLLERVDEIFWLIRAGSSLTEAELELLKKLAADKQKPYIIINAIDQYEGNLQTFIMQEKERYGQYVESFVPISAKQAVEATRENDTQKLIDSNFTQFGQLIDSLAGDERKKINHTIVRFKNWLNLYIRELQQLPMREPFSSAITSVLEYNDEQLNGTTKEERDRVIIQAYRDEYKEVSEIFTEVETLYQLLQKLAATFYLRDEEVEQFEELAFLYQQNVRDYRKKHIEYVQMFSKVEEHYRKTFRKQLLQWSPEESNEQITSQVLSLRKMYAELNNLMETIMEKQNLLLQNFYETQNHLTELAKKRMQYIVNQLADLVKQRKVEMHYLKSYNDKIKEFKCLELGQHFLIDALKPFILKEMTMIDVSLREQIAAMFTELEKCELVFPSVQDEAAFSGKEREEVSDFVSDYPLTPLSLTEADIISEIPDLPASI